MSDLTISRESIGASVPSASDLYRAVWRWHFYAQAFSILPFLITLAITGGLYLFKDEIDAVIHSDLKRVEVQRRRKPSCAFCNRGRRALAAHPGTPIKFTDPATPDATAEITVGTQKEGKFAVTVRSLHCGGARRAVGSGHSHVDHPIPSQPQILRLTTRAC